MPPSRRQGRASVLLRRRNRAEIIVVDIALLHVDLHGVDDLLIARRAEGGDGECLRFAA